jgi:hypothetical protein
VSKLQAVQLLIGKIPKQIKLLYWSNIHIFIRIFLIKIIPIEMYHEIASCVDFAHKLQKKSVLIYDINTYMI